MNTGLLLIWLHVVANVLWIGAICGVAVILGAREGDPKVRGELGRRLYLHLAVPAFGASFVLGVLLIVVSTAYYMKSPWMHAKLTVALVIIVLHHVIGARAKKMASGDVPDAGKTGVMALVIGLLAAAAAFFVKLELPGG